MSERVRLSAYSVKSLMYELSFTCNSKLIGIQLLCYKCNPHSSLVVVVSSSKSELDHDPAGIARWLVHSCPKEGEY